MPAPSDIPESLLEQRGVEVDPGELQILGKKAANLYKEGLSKLSEAVVQAIGTKAMGPEHVKRVCEFANQEAFQNEWDKGGSVRNIEFDGGPASPSDVLRNLNDGSKPKEHVISDYDEEPVKTSSVASHKIDRMLFGKFAHPMMRTPAVSNPLPEVRSKIASAKSNLLHDVSALETEKMMAAEKLASVSTNAILDGETPSRIKASWERVGVDKFAYKEASKILDDKMASRGIQVRESEKTSSRVPNPANPVVSSYIHFAKVAHLLRVKREAMKIMDNYEKSVMDSMRK